LEVANENTTSARSRIQDTDMAREATAYATMNVMYQAGISIMTQANQRPQQVLALLNR
jgi:flagellin